MKSNEIAITIRFPKELADTLRDKAVSERRSLNGQVIHLVESAMLQPQETGAEAKVLPES